jgi:hypothetical protein
MAYVYRHIRLDKNEPFYIGIGTDENFKRAYLFTPTMRNKIWNSIYSKTKVEVEILFDNITFELAKEKEKEFIELYGRKYDGGTLANITLGGEGVLGIKQPKLSERNKSGLWKGKKHKAESKEKIRAAHTGVKKSEIHIEKMREFAKTRTNDKNSNYRGKIYAYKDGQFYSEYHSLIDAANKVNGSVSMISTVINGHRNIYRGLFFTRTR